VLAAVVVSLELVMERVVILGDGAWGTALAMVAAERGVDVVQWGHDARYATDMESSRGNPRYLPGVTIPDGVTVTGETDAIADGELVVSAIPSRYLRETVGRLSGAVADGVPIVSATKGIELSSGRRATEILREVLGEHPLAVLSGPSHAEEVAQRMPTTVVVASTDQGLAMRVQDVFTTERFRVYTSPDPVGVELGGALKNVLSIAGGMVDGLLFGDNTKAALLTRGQAEMQRLGITLGGRPETFQGLSGIGDLVVSCISSHGRNRMVGERIGRGEKIDDIVASMAGVPEGVLTSKVVVRMAREHGVEMPISTEIHAVLFEGKNPLQAVQDLMTRPQKEELAV